MTTSQRLMLGLALFLGTAAAAGAQAQPLDVTDAALDTAVRQVVGTAPPILAAEGASAGPEIQLDVVSSTPGGPAVTAEVTVSDEVAVDARLIPDYTATEPVGYRSLPEWARIARFPDLGQSNSPGFDPVTQTYWWE